MKLPALFRAVIAPSGGAGAEAATGAPADETMTRVERRRPVLRCYSCHSWRPSVLVYMSNGGHYCPRCARAVHAWSGAKPAGRRYDDVLNIDEGADATTPDSLTG